MALLLRDTNITACNIKATIMKTGVGSSRMRSIQADHLNAKDVDLKCTVFEAMDGAGDIIPNLFAVKSLIKPGVFYEVK